MAVLDTRLAPDRSRDRDRVHATRGARAVPRRGPAGRGQQRPPRSRLRARAGRQGPARVRRAGAQPRAAACTSAATTWSSPASTARRSCARATCAATARCADFERFCQLAQASTSSTPRAAHRRAERRAARLAPPRHGLRAADADRQAVHGQRRRPAERARDTHRACRDIALRRPRGDRADAGHDLARQLQLAAALGRPHARARSSSTPRPTSRSSSRRSCSWARCRRCRSRPRSPSRSPRRWPASRSSQLIAPGRPVILGSFLSNIDMQSGSPQFGTPGVGDRPALHRPDRAPLRPARGAPAAA